LLSAASEARQFQTEAYQFQSSFSTNFRVPHGQRGNRFADILVIWLRHALLLRWDYNTALQRRFSAPRIGGEG